MTPYRWQEIEEVFTRYWNMGPNSVSRFSPTGAKAMLGSTRKFSSLVSSFEQIGTFFDATASSLAAEMFGDRIGETIGPYQINSGGMGTHDGSWFPDGRRILLRGWERARIRIHPGESDDFRISN